MTKSVSSTLSRGPAGLVSYWSRLGNSHVHPDDMQHVRAPDFATDLLPVPWAGPLCTAKVYFLFLNPGLTEQDRVEEARPAFKTVLRANLSGDQPYFYLMKEYASHPGHKWARQTFGSDVTEASAGDICMLQLVPYHSEKGDVARRVAPTLPSSLMIRRFVSESLIPRAMAGEIGIVVARSAKLWGIDTQADSIVIYRGAETRRAFQTAGSRGGRFLRQKLQINK